MCAEVEGERGAVRHARLNSSLAVFLRSVARAGVDGVAVLEAIVADAVDVLEEGWVGRMRLVGLGLRFDLGVGRGVGSVGIKSECRWHSRSRRNSRRCRRRPEMETVEFGSDYDRIRAGLSSRIESDSSWGFEKG